MKTYPFVKFLGALIPADVKMRLESCVQLPALNVGENIYSQFHGTYPSRQQYCKSVISFFLLFFGWLGEGGSMTYTLNLVYEVQRKKKKQKEAFSNLCN